MVIHNHIDANVQDKKTYPKAKTPFPLLQKGSRRFKFEQFDR
jgi:hypothetical protein